MNPEVLMWLSFILCTLLGFLLYHIFKKDTNVGEGVA